MEPFAKKAEDAAKLFMTLHENKRLVTVKKF